MDSQMRDAPSVALTANATKTDIDKCLSSGMNDYLPKPFTPDDLYQKICGDLNIKTQDLGILDNITSTGQTAFDLAYLRTVSDNNSEFLRDMIDTFMQSIPPV